MFPIQSSYRKDVKPHPTSIPWSIADLAYSVYSASYGREQSLERLAERGGFGPEEMDVLVPNWRVLCSDSVKFLEQANELAEALKLIADKHPRCDCMDAAGIANDALTKFKRWKEGA